MQLINYLILILPSIRIFFIICLIYNIIAKKRDFRKLGIFVITPILIISIVLVVYYWPVSNILDGNNIASININIKHQNVEITDKAEVNKIVETVNKYKFTKSASRSIMQNPYAADYLIQLQTYEFKKRKMIFLFVLSDLITKDAPPTIEHSPEENALEINEQMYNSNDNNGLSIDIYNLIKEFAVWDSKPIN